jgi:hypothetical protein
MSAWSLARVLAELSRREVEAQGDLERELPPSAFGLERAIGEAGT